MALEVCSLAMAFKKSLLININYKMKLFRIRFYSGNGYWVDNWVVWKSGKTEVGLLLGI